MPFYKRCVHRVSVDFQKQKVDAAQVSSHTSGRSRAVSELLLTVSVTEVGTLRPDTSFPSS